MLSVATTAADEEDDVDSSRSTKRCCGVSPPPLPPIRRFSPSRARRRASARAARVLGDERCRIGVVAVAHTGISALSVPVCGEKNG